MLDTYSILKQDNVFSSASLFFLLLSCDRVRFKIRSLNKILSDDKSYNWNIPSVIPLPLFLPHSLYSFYTNIHKTEKVVVN